MTDEQILSHIIDGARDDEILCAMLDADVASGEYEGCSLDLELAATEYAGRIARIRSGSALKDTA